MIRRPPRSTRTDTLFPYTTLFRSLGFNCVLREQRLNEARRAQAMQYQSTVFGQMLKAVSRGWFERVAREHASGRATRRLSAWGHVVAMVGAQLCGARSLRALERMLLRQPRTADSSCGKACVSTGRFGWAPPS